MSDSTVAQQSATYQDLMLATDSQGQNWSYLASEEKFRTVRDLERRNLIVPLVGGFRRTQNHSNPLAGT